MAAAPLGVLVLKVVSARKVELVAGTLLLLVAVKDYYSARVAAMEARAAAKAAAVEAELVLLPVLECVVAGQQEQEQGVEKVVERDVAGIDSFASHGDKGGVTTQAEVRRVCVGGHVDGMHVRQDSSS
jgi:hypothetical protein